MQYVPSVFPYRRDIGAAEQPVAVSAVLPPRRVVPRTVVPLLFQHRRGETRMEADKDEGHAEQPRQEDRRQVCRRVAQVAVTLDTRSGHDRRHTARRGQDHLEGSVDVEA